MFMTNVEMSELGNGVRVVTSAMEHVESVSIGVWVASGGRYETKALNGTSHFIEHLLFKGTQKRSARDISRAIEGRGGYLNAFTQEENTCYFSRVAFDQLETAMDVLCDMYLNARLSQEDIAKERDVIVEEIMMYRDQPHHVVHELLTSALWRGHPLGLPISGTPEVLASVSRRDIMGYMRDHYVPGNTVIAVAGQVDHAKCVDLVRGHLGRRRARHVPRPRRVTAKTRRQDMAAEGRAVEQTHVAAGYRLFGRRDPRRYPLRVMNAVLGENMSSRLFQVVRETHGLAYSIHSSCHLYQDTGALLISAGLDRKRSRRALDLVAREVRKLKTRRIGAREMRRAKDYVTGQIRLSLESTSHQMMWLGDNILAHGAYISPDDVIERVEKVTADEVLELANTVLNPDMLSLAVVGPEDVCKAPEKLRIPFKAD